MNEELYSLIMKEDVGSLAKWVKEKRKTGLFTSYPPIKINDLYKFKWNDKEKIHATILHLAVKYSKVKVVKWILKEGIDINLKDEKNETPLEVAICFGSIEVVNVLFAEALSAIIAVDEKNDLWTIY